MMSRQRAAAALGLVLGLGALLIGCGSDTSAEVFVPTTPTPAALMRVAVPTATPIPDGA